MLAEKIKMLREERFLSQDELAKKIGSTRSAVSSWERGLRAPSPKNIAALSEFFGVSVDYLCGKALSRNFINTLVTEEIDLSKLNYKGIAALKEYYGFLLTQDKYTNYDI